MWTPSLVPFQKLKIPVLHHYPLEEPSRSSLSVKGSPTIQIIQSHHCLDIAIDRCCDHSKNGKGRHAQQRGE